MKNNAEKIVVFADTSTQHLYLSKANIGPEGFSNIRSVITLPDKKIPDWFSTQFKNFLKPEGKNKIQALAVGKGPGSFTGLRISFSYLRTFALLLKVPLLSFPSGRLWQNALCQSDELLLTRLNKDLYSGYLPEVDFKAPLSVDNWLEYLKVNPEQKTAVWDGAMQPQKPISNHQWTDRVRFVSKPKIFDRVPLSFTELESEKNASIFEALPDYGHNISLHRTEKKKYNVNQRYNNYIKERTQ